MTITVSLGLEPPEVAQANADERGERKSLTDIVVDAFALVLDGYESELRRLPPDAPLAEFPQLKVILYEEDGEEDVVLDGALFATLIESFVFDGWAGIGRLQAAIEARAPDDTARRVAGAAGGSRADEAYIWWIARRYFQSTRSLLALLVREALISLELTASAIVGRRLQRVLDSIAEARRGALRESEWVREREGRFALKDNGVANKLFRQLSEIMQQLSYARELAKRILVHDPIAAPGSDAAERGSGHNEFPSRGAALAAQEQALRSADAAAALIEEKTPLAILALGKLEPGFDRATMEEAIGAVLAEHQKRCEKMSSALASGLSQVATRWARPPLDSPATAEQLEGLEAWTAPRDPLEWAAAQTVFAMRAPRNFAWLPLSREDVLQPLIEDDALAGNGFEYSVCIHYLGAWQAALERAEDLDQSISMACTRISQVSALVALLASRSPPAAASMAQTVSHALFFAATAWSVGSGLSDFDKALQAEALTSDNLSRASLSTSASLARERDQFIVESVKGFLIDQLLARLAPRWGIASRAYRLRNYYQDAETILELLPHD